MEGLGFSLCAVPLDIAGSCISQYTELEPQKRGVRQLGERRLLSIGTELKGGCVKEGW